MIDNNNSDNDNDDNDNDDNENDNDDDTDNDIYNHQVPVCKDLQLVNPCYPFPINSVLLCLGEKTSMIIKMFSCV